MLYRIRTLTVCTLLFSVLLAVACSANKPTIVISSPPSNSTYNSGDAVAVQSTASDPTGVVRVELTVDGAVVRNDTAPAAQTNYSLIQTWPAQSGTHTLAVRAYNVAGVASDSAAVAVVVNAQASGSNSAPVPEPTREPARKETRQAEATETSAVPAASAPTACTNGATFVADVTIPDGTSLNPGQQFNKVWRLKNTGTCVWTTAYDFAFVSGEAMATAMKMAAPQTNPGETADLLVAMTAPSTPGAHKGVWRLRGVDDAYFGGSVTVAINVVDQNAAAQPPAPPAAPATVPPTAAPPPQQSSTCSGTPNVGNFTASPSSFGLGGGTTTLSWDAVTNADSVEIDNGIGGEPTPGSTTASVSKTTTFTLTAHCGSNTKTAQTTVTVLNYSLVQPAQPLKPGLSLLFTKVTGAAATVTKGTCDSHATAKFTFNATITTDGAGDVSYQWVDSNSGSGSTLTLHFGAAGTQNVPALGPSSIGWTGQKWIHVTSPNTVDSNKVTYKCP